MRQAVGSQGAHNLAGKMHKKKSHIIKQIIRRVVSILKRSTVFWLLGEPLFVADHILLRRVPATLENHLFLFSVFRINFSDKDISPWHPRDFEYFACLERMRYDLGIYYGKFLGIQVYTNSEGPFDILKTLKILIVHYFFHCNLFLRIK